MPNHSPGTGAPAEVAGCGGTADAVFGAGMHETQPKHSCPFQWQRRGSKQRMLLDVDFLMGKRHRHGRVTRMQVPSATPLVSTRYLPGCFVDAEACRLTSSMSRGGRSVSMSMYESDGRSGLLLSPTNFEHQIWKPVITPTARPAASLHSGYRVSLSSCPAFK
jgi:hypothetical protein